MHFNVLFEKRVLLLCVFYKSVFIWQKRFFPQTVFLSKVCYLLDFVWLTRFAEKSVFDNTVQ